MFSCSLRVGCYFSTAALLSFPPLLSNKAQNPFIICCYNGSAVPHPPVQKDFMKNHLLFSLTCNKVFDGNGRLNNGALTERQFNIFPLKRRQAPRRAVTGSRAEALTYTHSSYYLCCHDYSCQQLTDGGVEGWRGGEGGGGGGGCVEVEGGAARALTDSCDRYIILLVVL